MYSVVGSSDSTQLDETALAALSLGTSTRAMTATGQPITGTFDADDVWRLE